MFGALLSIIAVVCIMKASDFSRPVASSLWFAAALALAIRLRIHRVGASETKIDTFHREISAAICDPLLLMAAGYCNDWVVKICGVPVGWVAAVLAVFLAFIRLLGTTLTGSAEPGLSMPCGNRIRVLIAACLGSIIELWVRDDGRCAEEVMRAALGLLVVVSAVMCWRRIRLIWRQLRSCP